MTDTDDRADRVRTVTESNHGRVVSREGDAMMIEVPADIAPALGRLWGEGRYALQFTGQITRLAPRRVADISGQVIVCDGDMVTTAFYRYRAVLSCGVHTAGADRRHRLSEQDGDLRPAVQSLGRDHAHDRGRSQASRRSHRPHLGAPHVGLRAHPPHRNLLTHPFGPSASIARAIFGGVVFAPCPAVSRSPTPAFGIDELFHRLMPLS